MAKAFTDAEAKVLEMMVTLWTKSKTPTLTGRTDPTGAGSPVAWLQDHTYYLVGFVAVLGVLVAAGRLAWQRRGEPARDVASGLLTLVVVTWCGSAAVALAVVAGDGYSDWIIAQAFGGTDQFAGELTRMSTLAGTKLAPGLVIVVALCAILSCLVQMGLMLVRVAMLGLLTGLLPIAGAAALTPEGRVMWRRMLGWLIAFVLYKPVAATIYAFSIKSIQNPSDLSQLTGIIMIIMAVAALPALMRFVVPMVSAPTRGGSGAGSGAAATGTAMGARLVPSLSGAGGGGAGRATGRGGLWPEGSKLPGPGQGGRNAGSQPAGRPGQPPLSDNRPENRATHQTAPPGRDPDDGGPGATAVEVGAKAAKTMDDSKDAGRGTADDTTGKGGLDGES
jgi:hypothetical protein